MVSHTAVLPLHQWHQWHQHNKVQHNLLPCNVPCADELEALAIDNTPAIGLSLTACDSNRPLTQNATSHFELVVHAAGSSQCAEKFRVHYLSILHHEN